MYCGSYVYFLLIERAKKKVSQEDTLFLFVKYRPRDLEQLALWKGLLRPFSEAELKQLTRGATSNTYWKISNISKAFHFLNIMGVHQRQRPVPKGHATRPKIIVLLGYFSVRKKRTRLLATIFRYTSTAPLCDFCHSFLFLSILHFSIAAATPPRYSSPFLQSFCRSFLEGHTSRFLVRAWYFCILEQKSGVFVIIGKEIS